MSLQDKASIVLPKGFAGKAGTLECWNPNSDSLVGLSVVRATNAWRINEAGAWEVSASNVPRRDFLNGGCGDLLIEPQRTNLFLNSATGATQSITVASGSAYSVSFSGTGSITFLGGHTGTLSGTGAAATDRVSTTFTTSTTSVTCTISGTVEYVNFELGSYSTSWIETAGAAVTRNADVISGTGLAALLGDSAGGLFVEASVFSVAVGESNFISLSDGTGDNRTAIGFAAAVLSLNIRSGASLQANIQDSGKSANTFYKSAGRYANNNAALYVDGVQVGTDNTVTTYTSGQIDDFYFDGRFSNPFYGRIRELVIFNEAPDNDQLAAITTP